MRLSIRRLFRGLYRLCECDCGKLIKIVTERGNIRRFETNHDKRGENHHKYNNGISNHREYIIIYKPDHPNAQKSGWIPEHRYIMSQFIGRSLEPNEEVHHINGNEKDNRIENLQLVTSSEHTIIHNSMNMDNRVCLLCGITQKERIGINKRRWTKHKNGIICNRCYLKLYNKKKKEII